jgi:predicted AlkP superfamily pyrophosphatase or phosphodiesterase
MKPLFIPDYKHTIMNVSCSILKHYGYPVKYDSIALLDDKLEKNYQNIVLILIDALGKSIIDKYPSETTNLRKDYVDTVSSVFPPTTVAATTSVLTGEPPIRTGWLGWSQYIKEEDKSVILFTNKDYYDDDFVFTENIANKYVPITNIYAKIKEASPDVETKEIFPAFREPEHDSFHKQCETIIKIVSNPGRHFVYTYWDKLDYNMHQDGPESELIRKTVSDIDEAYHFLTENLPKDTIAIVIADHSQIGVLPINLFEYKDVIDTFAHEPSIESRAAAFFIKKGKESEFEDLFTKHFGRYFILYKPEEVLGMNLFGFGEEHPRLRGFLGDYLAIAIDNYHFRFRNESFVMKGQHAGFLAEETLVPLIVHEKRR